MAYSRWIFFGRCIHIEDRWPTWAKTTANHFEYATTKSFQSIIWCITEAMSQGTGKFSQRNWFKLTHCSGKQLFLSFFFWLKTQITYMIIKFQFIRCGSRIKGRKWKKFRKNANKTANTIMKTIHRVKIMLAMETLQKVIMKVRGCWKIFS